MRTSGKWATVREAHFLSSGRRFLNAGASREVYSAVPKQMSATGVDAAKCSLVGLTATSRLPVTYLVRPNFHIADDTGATGRGIL